MIGAIAIALPLGVGAAIYLVEYTREGRITRLIRTGVDLLNGTPSIVFGLFGFAFIVLYLNVGVSMIAGQITLALMVLPTIIRTTEESLKNIPHSLREGSLALGATRWQTISKVVLPPAVPGHCDRRDPLHRQGCGGDGSHHVHCSCLLTAVPAFVSLSIRSWRCRIHLFILATNVSNSTTNRYGTALVLLMLVVGFYSVAILVRTHFQNKTRG